MGFVEQNLMAGEKVEFQTKLWRQPPWAQWVAIVVEVCLVAAWGIGLVLFVFHYINYLRWKGSEFIVTDKRVIMKTGVISANTVELLLQKVEAVQVQQAGFDATLDRGTIKIAGTGGTRETFKGIRSPIVFRNKIYQQIEAKAATTARA